MDSVGQTQTHSKRTADVAVKTEQPSTNGRTNVESNAKGQKQNSRRQRLQGRDELAFGTPIDQSLNQDFDFETNLALFNKEVRQFNKILLYNTTFLSFDFVFN